MLIQQAMYWGREEGREPAPDPLTPAQPLPGLPLPPHRIPARSPGAAVTAASRSPLITELGVSHRPYSQT